jgi:hypothetical protein
MKRITNFDKFNMFFSKNEFDKKYPLFTKYEFNEIFKNNAVDNSDLLRKYRQYNQTISIYLFELDKRFDKETIRNIIIESIVKNPDEIMMSLITAYLNSSESVKSNSLFVKFYNKTSDFGIDSIEYMQENGIVLDRSYKNIPALAIDSRYEAVKTKNEIFKNELLDDVYDNLTYPERRYAISLIENNSYGLLDILFGRFNFNTKSLIKTLMNKGINDELINNELINELDAYPLMILFCYMIEDDDPTMLVRNIILLVRNKRFDLLKKVIENNNLENIKYATNEELMSDEEEFLNLLETKKANLLKIEEVA